jgi:hypothetical protein
MAVTNKDINSQLRLELDEPDGMRFTRSTLIVFLLLVGLFVAARLWNLGDYNLWSDEIFSLKAARQSWGRLFHVAISDAVHPPLFYILLKIWIWIGGQSVVWLHLLPTVIAIATIIPLFLLARELRLSAAAFNLVLLFMAVNGYLIFYSLELRMYSLTLLLTICSLWAFVRFFNSKSRTWKELLPLFAVNVLLVYSHYYGWLVVGIQFLFLLFWGRHKLWPFSITAAAVAVCFSPWAVIVITRAAKKGGIGNLEWLAQPDALSLAEFFGNLHGAYRFRGQMALGLLLFSLPIFAWAWEVLRRDRSGSHRRNPTLWWLVLLSFLPVLISFAGSQMGRQSVWNRRYLIIVAAPYMFLVAIAVFKLRPPWLRNIALLLVTGWAVVAGFQDRQFSMRQRWRSVEPVVKQMVQAESGKGGVVVYVFDRNLFRMVRLYVELADPEGFQVKLVNGVEDITEDHFWVATREFRNTSPQVREQQWASEGYGLGQTFQAVVARQDRFVLLEAWREEDIPKP